MKEAGATPPIVGRPFKADDLDALWALDCLCFDPPFRFSLAMLRRLVRSPKCWTLVATQPSGRPVGFVVVEVGEPAYVATLDVHPDARRGGLGTRLLRAAEEHVLLQGATAMRLHVSAANGGAVRFYEAQGYTRLCLERNFYSRGLDAFLYEKPLQP